MWEAVEKAMQAAEKWLNMGGGGKGDAGGGGNCNVGGRKAAQRRRWWKRQCGWQKSGSTQEVAEKAMQEVVENAMWHNNSFV